EYLEHDERPTYLKPPSRDKNTPMKRKADEGGTNIPGWPEQESKDSLGGLKIREKLAYGPAPIRSHSQRNQRCDFLVDEKDSEVWKDLRELVTKEKFPWPSRKFPARNFLPCSSSFCQHRAEYYVYLGLFYDCGALFREHMNNVVLQLDEAYINIKPKFGSGASLGNEPDMKTILRIETTASNQQWPPAANDGNAGMSHGSKCADRLEFGYIPGFDLGQPDDTTTMRHYADPSGYGISTEYYHAYTGDDSSIEGTTSFAHPPTYAPAGPSSPYAGTGVSYLFPTIDPADLFSPNAGVSTPYPPTYAPAGPSEYGSPHPPSGSRRLKRRSARFRS
ncbi:hypothetical protein SeLEV6574_g07435, partial [Synchytrium endobioticum]